MARRKMTAEHLAAKARRDATLETIRVAIADGRAYLETAWGRRKVVGYNDETGWAFTNNTGMPSDDRSFMICLDAIKIG